MSYHRTSATSCKDVIAVYVRGSGENTNSVGYTEFRKQIIDDFSQWTLDTYDLGSKEYGGYRYEATAMADNPVKDILAAISFGYWFSYGNSVTSGINELKSYLEQYHTQCHSTYYVLGGYSQGAQVVGDTNPSFTTFS